MTDTAAIIQRKYKKPGKFGRTLRRDFVGYLGITVLALVVLASVFAEYLTDADPLIQNLPNRYQVPSWLEGGSPEHLLGTDHVGRDVWTRLLYAGQVSLTIGISVSLVAGLIGATLGIIAGWRGGWFSTIVLRLVDVQTAFPFLVVAIAVVAVLGNSIITLIATLVVWTWVPFARVSYSAVEKVKHQEFVTAAKVSGVLDVWIVLRHVVPNIVSPLLVIWTFTIAEVIVAESGLSFLGLGVQPPTPTWGVMINQGRENMDVTWWTVVFPALAIVLVVLSVNLVGDWLRDRLDPKMRR